MSRTRRTVIDNDTSWDFREGFHLDGPFFPPPEEDYFILSNEVELFRIYTGETSFHTEITVWGTGLVSFGPPSEEQIAFMANVGADSDLSKFPGDFIAAGFSAATYQNFEVGVRNGFIYIEWEETQRIEITPDSITLRGSVVDGFQTRLRFGDDSFTASSSGVETFFLGELNIKEGTAGADDLQGTEAPQALLGLGGNDRIIGGIRGDRLSGGSGNDLLDGGDGFGSDRLFGGTGHDMLVGRLGDDRLEGGSGNDILDPGSGRDSGNGGDGEDRLLLDFTGAQSPLRLAIRQESVVWTFESESFSNMEMLELRGGEHGDVLTGTGGDDRLFGNGGRDVLIGGLGDDLLDGGAPGGNNSSVLGRGGGSTFGSAFSLDYAFDKASAPDIANSTSVPHVTVSPNGTEDQDFHDEYYTFTVARPGATVTIDVDNTFDASVTLELLDRNGALIASGSARGELDPGSERDEDDVLVHQFAAAGTYVLRVSTAYPFEGGGDDGYKVHISLTSADIVPGNRLRGGAGNDVYVVHHASDKVVETVNAGTDLVRSSVSWTLGANLENLVLTGTSAIKGSGNGLANAITGNSGINRLDGKDGADRMAGLGGNDVYVVDNVGDVISEASTAGAGTEDRVESSVSYTLSANVERLVLTGTAADGTGNLRANVITGNALANTLNGGAGADTLSGGAGDDIYIVDNAGDVVTELSGEGTDEIRTSLAKFSLAGVAQVENLTGTSGTGQALTGDSASNRIGGGSGNDVINGGAGADSLAGSQGDDSYVIDDALDVVTEASGEGKDEIRTALASFSLAGHDQIENLTGTLAAGQSLTGNGGANRITGSSGNDAIDGGTGADALAGGRGHDTYLVEDAGDVVTELASQGTDEIRTSLGSFSLAALAHVEKLTGTVATGQVLTGNAAANLITGEAGNDMIDGGTGADTLVGGAGNDTYLIDTIGEIISETSTGGTGDLVRSAISYTLGDNLENLILAAGTAALDGTGNALVNRIVGNTGINRLDGKAGADTMEGGAGNDTYFVDTYDVSTSIADDRVIEAAAGGIDTVNSSVSYILASNVENLVFAAGTAALSGTGNALVNRIVGNAGTNRLDGKAGADTMEGGAGNDAYVVNGADVIVEASTTGAGTADRVESSVSHTLAANVERLTLTGTGNINGNGNLLGTAANLLTGNGGNNRLDGKGGADRMTGGDGNDTYVVEAAGDVVLEANTSAAGTADRVESSVSYTLAANVEQLRLTGTADINGTGTLVGTAANILTGNSGNNRLDGKGGADRMTGLNGNDVYVVDNVGDAVIERSTSGAGTADRVQTSITYTLAANVEHLTLTGTGTIRGTGNGAANTIVGNGAANTLNGGAGKDLLTGGAGADRFLFDTTLNATTNWDDILDFSVAADTIELDRTIFTKILVNGTLNSNAFVTGTAATDGFDRIIYDRSTGNIFYDSDGNGAAAKILFAQVNAGTVLTNADFFAVA